MSISSPCEICLGREVRHTCGRCAQLVCDEHFEKERGLCTECVAEVGDRPEHIPDKDDMPDGVDTYEF